MSRTLIVNNIPFEIPEQGEQQPWGEGVTEFLTEVAKVLNSVNGPSDILESSADVVNNQSSVADVAGMFFDSTTVRSFRVDGNVYRTTGVVEASEQFILNGLYQGASGWALTREGEGDAGITFSITSSGQIQYTSTNIVGQTSGKIKFRGIGILKA
jgi:hypothetical protein